MTGQWVPYENRPEVIEARLREERSRMNAVETIRWRSENPHAVPLGYQRPPTPPQAPEPAASAPAPSKPKTVPRIVNNAKPAWAVRLSPDKERALGAARLAEERAQERRPAAPRRAPARPASSRSRATMSLSGEALASSVDGYPIWATAAEVERIALEALGEL